MTQEGPIRILPFTDCDVCCVKGNLPPKTSFKVGAAQECLDVK